MTKTELKRQRTAENKIRKNLNHFTFNPELQTFVCSHCQKPHPPGQITECDFLALELAPIGMAVLLLRGHESMGRLVNNPLLLRRAQTAWTRAKDRALRDHEDKIVHLKGIVHTTSRQILNEWILLGDQTLEHLLTP
jgi:hypothetical protein